MIGRQTFEAKHGTAERWHVCDCEECLAGRGIVTTAHDLQQPWPDNRPPERLRAVDVESLALTFGEPPVRGGPYAVHERRCLADLDALTARCRDGAVSALRSLAFAARCVPGVLGAHAVPTGVGTVTVHACLADGADETAVRRAVWEASPATVAVSLDFHHVVGP